MSYFKFFIFIFILLSAFSCNNDNCNGSCESWQQCEEFSSITGELEYKCTLVDGACKNKNDCVSGQFCNNHYCEWVCSYPCNTWEVCNNKDECVKRKGYCQSDSECGSDKQCSQISFKCEEKCPTLCKNWEVCKDKVCNPRKDYCRDNSQCSSNKICNSNIHKCEKKCFPQCKEWEHCAENNECITDNGRCSLEKGCEAGYTCTKDHVCKKDPGECNPPCYDYWKTCLNNQCEKGDPYCEKNSDCASNEVCKKDHICHDNSNNNDTYCETGEECTGNTSCNLSTHKCENDPGSCTPYCKPWETCNKNNQCVKNDGFCTEDSQCQSGKCNKNHTCEIDGDSNSDTCDLDSECKSWQKCKNNSCVVDDDSCETGEECTGNTSCNLSTHKCENDPGNCNPNCKAWEECNASNQCVRNDGFCTEDSQCQLGKCNKNHICEQENNCILDSDCADWQKCKNNSCVIDDGTCTQDSECSEGYKCSGGACAPACQTPCEYWEECKNNVCVLKDNHCENQSTCKSEEECNSDHVCNKRCNPNCKPWQDCNNGTCENKNGYCTQNEDCNNGSCDKNTHKCKNNGDGSSCTVSCNEWEYCVNNNCQVSPGRCDNTHAPCESPLFCNADHVCEKGSGCNDSCLSWQYCAADGTCKNKEGSCLSNSECEGDKYCDTITHLCKDKPKDCKPGCASWQKCVECRPEITCGNPNSTCICLKHEANKCIPKSGKCASNRDCLDGKKCDLVKHECSDKLFCNDWEELKSPVENCYKLKGQEKTNCLQALDPNIACKDLTGSEKEECVKRLNNSKCNLKEDRCEARTYCGPNSICNLNNHYCEKLSNVSCPAKYEVAGDTCSLTYGNCISDYDCPLDLYCGENNSCEYRTCLNSMECGDAICEYDINGDGSFNEHGFCKHNSLPGVTPISVNNRNKLEVFNYLDSVEGIITHIERSTPYNKIYISENPDLNYSCKDNSNCVEGYMCKTCEDDDRCPKNVEKFCSKDGSKYRTNKKAIYNSLEILSKDLKGSNFDSSIEVGDSILVEGNYLNVYGNARFLSKKILFFNTLQCTSNDDCNDLSICKKLKYVNSEQKFCVFQKEYFNVLDMSSSRMAKNKNPNAAEGFESMFVNSYGEAPYTVTENSSASNGNKIKLRDANQEEFYISEDFSGDLGLRKGQGQCISKSCPLTRCPKYCSNGYKITDIDSDDIGKLRDNCKTVFNRSQADKDNDGKGDACDDDVDGDGASNTEDICPLDFNPDQEDGIGDVPEGEEEAPRDPCLDNYENDKDKDGVKDSEDNCPDDFNPGQENLDKFLHNKGLGAISDDKGDVCDDDIDGDGINNDEDPYDYSGTEPGCPTCNCAVPEESCSSDGNCSDGEKCYYYKTAIRTVKGILRYEPYTKEKFCNSNGDCSSNKCLTFPDGSNGICCENSSCTSNEGGDYSITPRSSSDYIKCSLGDVNCANNPIPDSWNTGL